MTSGRLRTRRPTNRLAARWGSNLKARREVIGLRQRQLSALSDVPQQTISRLENGVFVPSVDLLAKVCNGLGAEPTDVLAWPTLAELRELLDMKAPGA